jgi:hyperosmotically inducible protein
MIPLAVLLLVGGCAQREERTSTALPSAGPGSAVPSNSPPGPQGPGEVIGETAHTIGEAAAGAALAAKVKNALLISKDLDTSKLNVDASAEGVVTLTGSVPQAAQKARAEKMAKQIEGVQTVRNRLTVAP